MMVLLLTQLETEISSITFYKHPNPNDLPNCSFSMIICRVECDPKTQLMTEKWRTLRGVKTRLSGKASTVSQICKSNMGRREDTGS